MTWAWSMQRNRHGQPYVLGESEELCCMIHRSTFDDRKTSTTFWLPNQRYATDHYLKGEKFREMHEAQAFIESHTRDELLALSRPRTAQHKQYATEKKGPRKPPAILAEYNARRCMVCGGHPAHFGFPDNAWACDQHWRQVSAWFD